MGDESRLWRPRAGIPGDRFSHGVPHRRERGGRGGRRPGGVREGLGGSPSLSPGAPFRPWILQIVANEARNRRRAAGRRAHLTLRTVAATPSGGGGPLPRGDRSSTPHSARARSRAVNELREEDRLVIACRYFLELSEEETAAALGWRRGTVKSEALARPRPACASEWGRRRMPELELALRDLARASSTGRTSPSWRAASCGGSRRSAVGAQSCSALSSIVARRSSPLRRRRVRRAADARAILEFFHLAASRSSACGASDRLRAAGPGTFLGEPVSLQEARERRRVRDVVADRSSAMPDEVYYPGEPARAGWCPFVYGTKRRAAARSHRVRRARGRGIFKKVAPDTKIEPVHVRRPARVLARRERTSSRTSTGTGTCNPSRSRLAGKRAPVGARHPHIAARGDICARRSAPNRARRLSSARARYGVQNHPPGGEPSSGCQPNPRATMTAAELQDLDFDTEAERVLLWREEELERAGYDRDTARRLAEAPGVDLHLATELLRRGCPEPRLSRFSSERSGRRGFAGQSPALPRPRRRVRACREPLACSCERRPIARGASKRTTLRADSPNSPA
jgi:DNA-directed RNA polymerase specialized sigma24 family protein